MADILYDTRAINQNCPKVIILTHADADGLVAALVVKAFEELEARKSVLIMSCMDVSNETTEKTLTYICDYNDLSPRDKLYILDRPLPSLSWLKMCYLTDIKTINIDHHITNNPKLYENERCCDNIEFFWSDKKSAAYLALDYFEHLKDKSKNHKKLYDKLAALAIATSCWDIFTWKCLGSSLEDLKLKKRALSVNAAEKILGSIGFFATILKDLESDDFEKNIFDFFEKLNTVYNLRVKNIYDFAKRSISELSYKNQKIAVIFGVDTDYQSIVADMLFEDKKFNYEIIAFLNMFGNLSLRSKGNNDVSDLASKLGNLYGYNGGGHKNAAGCKIIDRDKIKDEIIRTFQEGLKKITY